ncbi:MAG TPA: hemerythrin domain-containing protein [Sediminibacterium sp.]|uniref:hemerythrin domain-containing protein n=1 Tax=Sediminibacterium sp. TaxID=1917865 RepID=UPI000A767065|nr:hemerythrin domain-containing protein [Sediminibacterium sp.]OYZ02216.1 MAG: hypothetical protein B7Y37_03690 [Sphingobacteriia bacterium 28-36-52]HLD54592.1 hemerythrin domain-containing protein [Sediminibacterium sp.]
MIQVYNYDTVSEALNDLAKRGFTHDFNIHEDADCLICTNTMTQLSPEEFEIVETYRFEGDTDPADEMIVFAISSIKHNLKGTLLNAYGIYADGATSKIVAKLEKNASPAKPINRAEYLKKLSREHHHGLLLAWKIKTGFSKKIPAERIKKYTDWFYTAHLKRHFQEEEKYVFPILGNDNILIQKAIQEHQQLAQLFNETDNLEMALKQIAIDLVNHIRFEERILFNQIQAKATPEQITMTEALHTSESFIDNTTDPFWN